jgi:crossover junction endodeoxyribonuclease RuvC
MMKILGIDPGTAIVGWSVIDADRGHIRVVGFGSIQSPKNRDQQGRLYTIYTQLSEIITKHHPHCAGVEALFFATNAKTAISVGEARGAILLTAALHGVPVISYSPLTVKQTICGDGKADKQAVAKMVKNILKLSSVPALDDITDALAIALTHAYSYKLKGIIK